MSEVPAQPAPRQRVVVVGGGFGGLNAVRALEQADVDVTLVDRTDHHLFQPLLYQVAAGILPPRLIAPAIRSVIKEQANARALLADVHELDLSQRVVRAEGPDARPVELPYDWLVVAAGATHSYFGRNEFAGYARHEDHPGRPPAARPHPVGVRDGRARHRSAGAGRVADVRRDRCRPDRGRARRSGRRARTRCCRATTGRSTPARRGSCCSRARPPCCCRSRAGCRNTPTVD